MQASVQFRPHNRDLGVVVREVDEDLAIFLGMKNGEKEGLPFAHIYPLLFFLLLLPLSHFLAFLISMFILGKIEFDATV